MGLGPYESEVAYRLSGGLQQRTLVAMILATEAPFLFLDEPTLGMDPFARRQVWEVIRAAARHGSTILLTTHYLDEAEQLSEQLAVIEGGHILYRGSVRELKARLGHEVRVEVSGGVTQSDLAGFGPVHATSHGFSVLTTQQRVGALTDLALARGAVATVGPVSLEEAFLEIVGRRIEEDES
jgi:ABC-2 type transport system ATP-binding protein